MYEPLLSRNSEPAGRRVDAAATRAYGKLDQLLPTRLRLSSLATLAAYAVFAALLLSRTGVLPGRDSTVVIVATWVLVGVLALSTVTNAVSGSRTERATMVPTGAVLTVAVLVIALGW
mgnify:CR=1 FL=1